MPIRQVFPLTWVDSFLGKVRIPLNLPYWWNFGSMLGLTLVIQIVTGVSLAFHYNPHTHHAFNSVQDIMIEQHYGYVLRYSHSNGASLFFIFVYIHIGRNIYFQSYLPPRIALWNIGVIIYILMMATAFLGYVLPFGNMSLWGAIVITNFFSTIPWLGLEIVYFLWGGFSVDIPTLTRFYALHFTLPWVLLGFVFIHIVTLHERGSNNPIGVYCSVNDTTFHSYYTYKDSITFIIVFILLFFLVGFYPNVLGHSDNYIKANPLITPSSIVPEWYFLPFYGILRSIPDKSYGVIAMACSILILFTLPFNSVDTIKSSQFSDTFSYNFWFIVFNFAALLYLGSAPVQYPYVGLAFYCTCNYFSYFLLYPAFFNGTHMVSTDYSNRKHF